MKTGGWIATVGAGAVAVGLAAYWGWGAFRANPLPEGFASSNGRIEAVEIDAATKTPGRIVDVMVDEGDFVVPGQVLAKMDTDVLNAQLEEAEAEYKRAETAVDTAKTGVIQRESEKAAAEAQIKQRQAELDLADRNYKRAQNLAEKDAVSQEELDTQRASFFGAQAALESSKATAAGADAAINTAKSQVIQAEASVNAAQAQIDRLKADIKDCTLVSPRNCRVQYRISQPGEVLPAGGKVLNMVDLGDVYMTFYLPTREAGLAKMGAEARIILDAAPQYVIPAKISFISDVAQFTPKTVETEEERQKLMFRLKAQIDPELLQKHIRSVKTGLPGMVYVRLDDDKPWPERLQVKVPETP
ncbi:HlyD family secretion protein [Blastopirellula marina]|uniref:Glycoside hydrolase family 43 n=1 Tax=Blastopirellula marina TaxID=124 RepID=A0A2S8GRG9_9BACT|nr:HlyD family efflux transporter periplasmic adaptor subunit [Blastopirellula marina]PQO47023.1 glycoside hydrolase family 43 [Blastopirellula marina]